MSDRPLYKKLGIKNDSIILVLNQPKNYIDFFTDFPSNVIINHNCENEQVEFIHIFVKTINELEHYFALGKSSLQKKGILWVSWPKKAFNVVTELDKFKVIKYGIEHGLVDVKVVSMDEVWSGQKFVYRSKDRK